MNYLKRPTDTIPAFDEHLGRSSYQIIRKHFFQAPYNEVYDFLEFAVEKAPDNWGKDLRNMVNRYLEEKNAAYRFAG